MTDIDTELREQRRWRPRRGTRLPSEFTEFLRQEFTDQTGLCSQRLGRVLRWSVSQVPYYRNIFNALSLTLDEISSVAELRRLPVLSKLDVQQHGASLRALQLPRGEKISGISRSSGTSGRGITEVVHTISCHRLWDFLKQRELRWFRFDPAKTLAWIRLPQQMPHNTEGKPAKVGQTVHLPAWPGLAQYFETGPFFGFSVLNPVEDQLAWLEARQPAYLLAYAESLEHLAFALGDAPAPGFLSGLIAGSEQVTPGMRTKIEHSFEAPLAENYGLNEVGVVASRCPEGGRFHVHVEACLVEIVDEAGEPVRPGERGRLLVTTLSNPAMPLLRYDTGDLAVQAEGPCRCGRTLPSFERISGRYSRIAFLPEGTLGVVAAVREAIETSPETLIAPLREFQLHQRRTRDFELRVVTIDALDNEFEQNIRLAFDRAKSSGDGHLAISRVDRIARSAGGKFRDFVSDFEPDPDGDDACGRPHS